MEIHIGKTKFLPVYFCVQFIDPEDSPFDGWETFKEFESIDEARVEFAKHVHRDPGNWRIIRCEIVSGT